MSKNRGRTGGCVDLQVPTSGNSIHHRTTTALLPQVNTTRRYNIRDERQWFERLPDD